MQTQQRWWFQCRRSPPGHRTPNSGSSSACLYPVSIHVFPKSAYRTQHDKILLSFFFFSTWLYVCTYGDPRPGFSVGLAGRYLAFCFISYARMGEWDTPLDRQGGSFDRDAVLHSLPLSVYLSTVSPTSLHSTCSMPDNGGEKG